MRVALQCTEGLQEVEWIKVIMEGGHGSGLLWQHTGWG